jgi:hypothetical protein
MFFLVVPQFYANGYLGGMVSSSKNLEKWRVRSSPSPDISGLGESGQVFPALGTWCVLLSIIAELPCYKFDGFVRNNIDMALVMILGQTSPPIH